MENFPWWTKKQRKLAKDVKVFAEQMMPRDVKACWKREFPWNFRKGSRKIKDISKEFP
jgi:hypothetical protein